MRVIIRGMLKNWFIPTFKNRESKAADEVGIPPQRGRATGTPGFILGDSIAFFILATGLFVSGWQNAVNSNPGDTFEIYRQALADADIEAYMSCITQGSKEMLAQRPPQAATMLREYKDIEGKGYKVTVDGSTAILEFQPKSEFAPPYMFNIEKGEWKIDLKRMSEEIMFDQRDHWHWKRAK